jgi:hypothetical protein
MSSVNGGSSISAQDNTQALMVPPDPLAPDEDGSILIGNQDAASATDNGAATTLAGGKGGATSGDGGPVEIIGGEATDGAGGSVNISSGSGVGGTNAGGDVNITAGSSEGGDPGKITIATDAGVLIQADDTGLGFFGEAPIAQPTVTGSAGANAALISLLAQLELLGLIVDGSS